MPNHAALSNTATRSISGDGWFYLNADTSYITFLFVSYPVSVGLQGDYPVKRLFGAGWCVIILEGKGVEQVEFQQWTERLVKVPEPAVDHVYLLQHHLIPGVVISVQELG